MSIENNFENELHNCGYCGDFYNHTIKVPCFMRICYDSVNNTYYVDPMLHRSGGIMYTIICEKCFESNINDKIHPKKCLSKNNRLIAKKVLGINVLTVRFNSTIPNNSDNYERKCHFCHIAIHQFGKGNVLWYKPKDIHETIYNKVSCYFCSWKICTKEYGNQHTDPNSIELINKIKRIALKDIFQLYDEE